MIRKEIKVMKLKRAGKMSLGIMMLIFLMGTAVAQDEPAFSMDAAIDYYGKYIWRGQQINDETVIQPWVSGSAYGFTGSIWANIDMTNFVPDNAGGFSEIDYSLDYSNSVPSFEKLGFSLGVIHYLFPMPSAASTTELYFGVSLDVLLSPSFTYYRDVSEIDGSYMQIGIGHSFETELKPDYSIGLELSGGLAWADSGYNRGYFGIDETKFNDLTIGIGVPFNLKHVTLTPSLNIASMLSKEIGGTTRNNVWFGVGLSKSF